MRPIRQIIKDLRLNMHPEWSDDTLPEYMYAYVARERNSDNPGQGKHWITTQTTLDRAMESATADLKDEDWIPVAIVDRFGGSVWYAEVKTWWRQG